MRRGVLIFEHILIPADCSVLACKAIQAGIAFAKEIGARVTGITLCQPHAVKPH